MLASLRQNILKHTIVIGTIPKDSAVFSDFHKQFPERRNFFEQHVCLEESLRNKRVFTSLVHRQLFRMTPSFCIGLPLVAQGRIAETVFIIWMNWLIATGEDFDVDKYFKNMEFMKSQLKVNQFFHKKCEQSDKEAGVKK